MTENEKKSIEISIRFYAKWREITIGTDKQWEDFAEDVGRLAADLSAVPCPLGVHLLEAVLGSINDLYKNGMKPVAVGYFGRADL